MGEAKKEPTNIELLKKQLEEFCGFCSQFGLPDGLTKNKELTLSLIKSLTTAEYEKDEAILKVLTENKVFMEAMSKINSKNPTPEVTKMFEKNERLLRALDLAFLSHPSWSQPKSKAEPEPKAQSTVVSKSTHPVPSIDYVEVVRKTPKMRLQILSINHKIFLDNKNQPELKAMSNEQTFHFKNKDEAIEFFKSSVELTFDLYNEKTNHRCYSDGKTFVQGTYKEVEKYIQKPNNYDIDNDGTITAKVELSARPE